MKPLTEKHIGKEDISKASEQLKENQEFIFVITSYLEDFLLELENEHRIEEILTPDESQAIPLRYINGYMQARELGFSSKCSRFYGRSKAFVHNGACFIEEYCKHAANDNCVSVLKDITLYCEIEEKDEKYGDYLVSIILDCDYEEYSFEEELDSNKINKKKD